MSGEQAQSKEDSGEHNSNDSSNDQLMSAATVVEWRSVDRRSSSRHGASTLL